MGGRITKRSSRKFEPNADQVDMRTRSEEPVEPLRCDYVSRVVRPEEIEELIGRTSVDIDISASQREQYNNAWSSQYGTKGKGYEAGANSNESNTAEHDTAKGDETDAKSMESSIVIEHDKSKGNEADAKSKKGSIVIEHDKARGDDADAKLDENKESGTVSEDDTATQQHVDLIEKEETMQREDATEQMDEVKHDADVVEDGDLKTGCDTVTDTNVTQINDKEVAHSAAPLPNECVPNSSKDYTELHEDGETKKQEENDKAIQDTLSNDISDFKQASVEQKEKEATRQEENDTAIQDTLNNDSSDLKQATVEQKDEEATKQEENDTAIQDTLNSDSSDLKQATVEQNDSIEATKQNGVIMEPSDTKQAVDITVNVVENEHEHIDESTVMKS